MRILVLTKSDKHKGPEGGYCIAGVTTEAPHKWVRLIGAHEHFKITDEEAVYRDGVVCQPLDIIDVEVSIMDEVTWGYGMCAGWDTGEDNGWEVFNDYPHEMVSIQPENYIACGRFEFVRKATIDEALKIAPIYTKPYLYVNSGKSLTEEEAIDNNESLALLKVTDLKLYPQARFNGDGYNAHYKASFNYNGTEYTDITVTDPDFGAELTNYSGLSFGETYLIVSVGEKFRDNYYKIIAKIFEVAYTIPNNKLNWFHAFKDCNYLERYANHLTYELYDKLVEQGMHHCPKCEERYNNL